MTQDVFLRVYRTVGTFRLAEGNFTTWLTSLTRNLLIDHYRKTKKEKLVDSLEEQLGTLEEKETLAATPDVLTRTREAGEVLQAALTRLSPDLREAVILRDLQEMEYREISQILKVPEGTVKSRINRGRATLGRILKRTAGPRPSAGNRKDELRP